MPISLNKYQRAALIYLAKNDGFLVSHIESKNEIDEFNDPIPGKPAYDFLIKNGLAFITEEEPFDMEDGEPFYFTPSIYLTDDGRLLAESIN